MIVWNPVVCRGLSISQNLLRHAGTRALSYSNPVSGFPQTAWKRGMGGGGGVKKRYELELRRRPKRWYPALQSRTAVTLGPEFEIPNGALFTLFPERLGTFTRHPPGRSRSLKPFRVSLSPPTPQVIDKDLKPRRLHKHHPRWDLLMGQRSQAISLGWA